MNIQLLKRRLRVCDKVKTVPAPFKTVLASMKPEAMSGDELTDFRGDHPRYAITNLTWRNPAIHAWFKTLDHLHLSTRFKADMTPTSGAFPHHRVPSRRVEDHQPIVPGLPINFYNPVFLEGMEQYEIDDLDIQPKLDLSFPPHVIR